MTQILLIQSGMVIYPLLFVFLMGGAVGLPIPEDLPLLAGGILIQSGKASWQLVGIISYAAILLGDVVIFCLGRPFGQAVSQKQWFKSRFSPDNIDRVRHHLEKHSVLTIFIARHLFYVRTLTFLTCGAVRMQISKFLLADAVAALISTPLMLGLGYLAADHYDTVLQVLKQTRFSLMLILLCAAAAYVIYRQRQKGLVAERVKVAEEKRELKQD